MKNLLLFIIVITSCNYAQKQNPTTIFAHVNMLDTELAKYSYPLVGFNDLENPKMHRCGTGFFIKINDGYKFITAKHVITGLSSLTKDTLPYSQYNYIGIVCRDTLSEIAILPIDIRTIKSQLNDKPFYEEPDMVVLKLIGIDKDIKINSIENMLPNPLDTMKKNEKAVIYGYPINYSQKSVEQLTPDEFQGTFANQLNINPIFPESEIYTRLQPHSKKGTSGAPVFFQYSNIENGNKSEWFEFGGVAFASDSGELVHITYIVSPKSSLNEINKVPTPAFTFNFYH